MVFVINVKWFAAARGPHCCCSHPRAEKPRLAPSFETASTMSMSTLRRSRGATMALQLHATRRVFGTLDGRAAAAATINAPGRQRLVVALGGNALLKRGEPLTFANQVRAPRTTQPQIPTTILRCGGAAACV